MWDVRAIVKKIDMPFIVKTLRDVIHTILP